MQKNITDSERIEKQLESEEQRFKEYGCVRRKLKYGSTIFPNHWPNLVWYAPGNHDINT